MQIHDLALSEVGGDERHVVAQVETPGERAFTIFAVIVLTPILVVLLTLASPVFGISWLHRYLTSSNSRRYVAATRRARRELKAAYPQVFVRLHDTGNGFRRFDYLGLWVLLKGPLLDRIPQMFVLVEKIPEEAKRVLSPSEEARYQRFKKKIGTGSISSGDPDFDWSLHGRYLREWRSAREIPAAISDADAQVLVAMQKIVERAFVEAGWSGAAPSIGFESAKRVSRDARYFD